MIRLTVFAVMFGIGTASLATVSFIDPASAATRHSTQYGNPDEGPYPASRSCEGTTCFALLVGEALPASVMRGARFLTYLSIHPGLRQGGSDECTVSGRTEPSRTR
jgi:hypothetical protein